MERMTYRAADGELFYGGGTGAEHLHRLADYEDTGLTPEEIKDMMTDWVVWKQAEAGRRLLVLPEPSPDINFRRMLDLLIADGQGRVKVLPCKEGKTVYCLVPTMCAGRDQDVCTSYCDGYDLTCEDYEGKKEIREMPFSIPMLDDIGETVFLTREEAEAALEKEEG